MPPLPPPPLAEPQLLSHNNPPFPPAGASDANVTRQQVQSWVAHAVATVDKKAGKGQAGKERTGKAKERGGRLPNDAWCKAGSCQYRHDEKFPNKPCYRNPDWDGGAEGLNYDIVSNPTRIARLLEDREKAGVRLGKKVKKLKYATGPAPAAAAVTCPGCDGLDDWAGGHASVSLGSFSSSPLAPCCPAAHTSLLSCSSVPISAELLEAQGLDDAELAALVIDDLDDSRDGPSSSRSSTPTPDHMRTHDTHAVPVGDPHDTPTWYCVVGTPMHGVHAVASTHDYDLFAASCERAGAFPRRCGTGESGHHAAQLCLTNEDTAKRPMLWWLCENEAHHRRAVISTMSQRGEEDLTHAWPAVRCFGSGREAESRARAALDAIRAADIEALRPPSRHAHAAGCVAGANSGLYPPLPADPAQPWLPDPAETITPHAAPTIGTTSPLPPGLHYAPPISERCRTEPSPLERCRRGFGAKRCRTDTAPTQYRSRRAAPILLRHHVGAVSESERCSDTAPTRRSRGCPIARRSERRGAPIPFRHGVGAVSESERCSDKVSEQDRSKISINSRFIELFIQHISSSS